MAATPPVDPASTIPFWIAGRPESSTVTAAVTNPYDGSVVGVHAVPTPEHIERAVAAAWAARHLTSAQPAAVRAEGLAHVSRRVTERADEIARLITSENGNREGLKSAMVDFTYEKVLVLTDLAL